MNPKTILLVEDEAVVAMDISAQLANLGYRVVGSAACAEEAIALAENLQPNIVLTDIKLSGPIDGISAAAEIRKRFGIPVVFLTAYSERSTLQSAILSQPFGYIIKPCQERELMTTIEMAIYIHATEQTLKQKIEELERFNQMTVDRELRMIELKKEVNTLHEKLGMPNKYVIVE